MDWKRFAIFAGKVILAHTVTYLIVGGVAYALLTNEFYVGESPIFASFMRTQAEPDLWSHVNRWFIPAQIVRGLLIAAVLYPFFDTLGAWPFGKRLLALSGLYLVLGYWAGASPAAGNIEGLVYLRPEITHVAHLKVQPEIIVQGLALSAWVAGWGWRRPRPAEQ